MNELLLAATLSLGVSHGCGQKPLVANENENQTEQGGVSKRAEDFIFV